MPITERDVDHVALLARLKLTPAEKETYTRQLNSILDYMEKLNTLDTAGVEPMAHVLPLQNVLREDRAGDCLRPEEALANAPQAEDGQFRVPRVL